MLFVFRNYAESIMHYTIESSNTLTMNQNTTPDTQIVINVNELLTKQNKNILFVQIILFTI